MISVVISTYDQPALTALHAKSCMGGTLVPDEIIVVNDGGDPATLDELRKIEPRTRLVYARINEDIPWNTNGAYNLGIFISRGDAIAIEDCDHIPYPDFYEAALKELGNGADRVLGRKRTFVKMSDGLKPYRSAGCHRLVGLYTREILLRMKGYDERFGGHYGWNGADIMRRLSKLGCKTSSASGFYMVSDGLSLKDSRPMIGTKPKMEKENYAQLRYNKREGGQVVHPMLNFTYEMVELNPNIKAWR